MRSSLRSSAEDSTPRETNPHDRISTSGQKTHKTKSKKNKKTKSSTLTSINLDVDPHHDISLRDLDISLLRSLDDMSETRFGRPTMTRQQMILARRAPLFNFPSSLYRPPPSPTPFFPPIIQHYDHLEHPSYDPPTDPFLTALQTTTDLIPSDTFPLTHPDLCVGMISPSLPIPHNLHGDAQYIHM